MKGDAAARRSARRDAVSPDVAGRLVNRFLIAKKDRAEARERMRSRGKSVRERQAELIEFYDRYESFVETLCDAAQYGPTPKLERSYDDLRRKFEDGYQTLRPFLISYLEFAPDDAQAGLKLSGRPLDAFEALVAAADLHEFLRVDDGNMISRITRTREALNLYGEHLRQLAARSA